MSNRLTSKGQVTIPKRLRDYLGLEPGQPVEFELRPDGVVAVKPHLPPVRPCLRLQKMIGSATSEWTSTEIMRMVRGR